MDQNPSFAKNLRVGVPPAELPSMLYPLQFEPIFRRYLWGGRRLATQLRKSLGAGDDYAESWEIVDHGQDQSRVVTGPWAGRSLHDLIESFGVPVLGATWNARIQSAQRPAPLRGRFPLLLKFLDAQRVLSVQVHPNDAQAAQQDPPDLGKTEAWYVLDAAPDSRIYAGLRAGIGRSEFETALRAGSVDSVLHSFEARPGDVVFIPAGTVHAIGAGLLVCEIQQASDTTYRLFDWNRVDASGKPRPLHIAESLDVIDFARGPVEPIRRCLNENALISLVHCDYFRLSAWQLTTPQPLAGDGRLRIVVPIDGAVQLAGSDIEPVRLSIGKPALLPAGLPPITCTPQPSCSLLVVELPEP